MRPQQRVAPTAVQDGFLRINTGVTDGMERIPGGDFSMGNDGDYGFTADGEGPAHTVTLAPFFIPDGRAQRQHPGQRDDQYRLSLRPRRVKVAKKARAARPGLVKYS